MVSSELILTCTLLQRNVYNLHQGNNTFLLPQMCIQYTFKFHITTDMAERQSYSSENIMNTRASFRSLSKLWLTGTVRYVKKSLYKISNDSYPRIIQRILSPLYSFACSNKLKISLVYFILQIHPFRNISSSASKSSITQTQYRHITPLKLNRMCWFSNVFKVIFPQESY